MKPAPFDYFAPSTLPQALRLILELGDRGKILAGGQSLVPAMNFRLARPEALIDINGLTELSYLKSEDGWLRVGALVRHAAFERPEPALRGILPSFLARVARHVAHAPIRHRGTFVGSLAHADPAAEWCAVALALEAEIVLRGASRERTLPARDFFRGLFTTALEPDEIVTEIRLPLLGDVWRLGFAEFSRRAGDFAVALAVVAVRLEGGRASEARIVLGGIADRPIRAPEAERELLGASLDDQAVRRASARVAATVEPFADIHATAEYRRDLAAAMTRRALRQAAAA